MAAIIVTAVRSVPAQPVFTGPPHPPDFKDIANAPNVTAATLQRHLSSLPAVPRRPSMANLELTSGQLRDVAAFILSLRDKLACGQPSPRQ